MSPRTILITGCSKSTGIGMAAARRLRADGHAVHATVRVPREVGPAAAGLGPGIPVHVLDLDDEATIVSAVREVETASGGIDVLVNNAGTGLLGAVESLERDLLASYHRLRAFIVATTANLSAEETVEVLLRAEERLFLEAVLRQPPFVMGIYRDGDVRQLSVGPTGTDR